MKETISGPNCAYFKNVTSKTGGGGNTSLLRILRAITSDEWRERVETIRAVFVDPKEPAAGLSKRKELKNALPGFMMSVTTTTGKHGKGDCGEHSGVVQVELDHTGAEQAKALRERLRGKPHILAAWISASGEGLKIAVRVDANKDTHPAAWAQAAAYIRCLCDFEPDPQTKHVNAICYVSYDPDMVLNDFESVEPLLVEGESNLHREAETQDTQDTQITQKTQGTQITQTPSNTLLQQGTCVVGQESFLAFDVTPFVVRAAGESNIALFRMGRRLKTFEKRVGRPSTWDERIEIFDRWWERSERYVDPNMDYLAFRGKWEASYTNVRYADDESPLDLAWQRVISEPLPEEALRVEGIPPATREKYRQLIAFCWHLSVLENREVFYLGCRDAGRLLGNHFTTANGWLDFLAAPNNPHRLLEKVSRGSKKSMLANEWRFLHAPPSEGGASAI